MVCDGDKGLLGSTEEESKVMTVRWVVNEYRLSFNLDSCTADSLLLSDMSRFFILDGTISILELETLAVD